MRRIYLDLRYLSGDKHGSNLSKTEHKGANAATCPHLFLLLETPRTFLPRLILPGAYKLHLMGELEPTYRPTISSNGVPMERRHENRSLLSN